MLAKIAQSGHYAPVGVPAKWRIQAFWRVGTDMRSYAPVFAATESEAKDVASDMTHTLAHFVGLDVRVDEVDADDEATPLSHGLPARPLLHALNEDHSATLCGTSIDIANAALVADMLDQAHGLKCSTCTQLLLTS